MNTPMQLTSDRVLSSIVKANEKEYCLLPNKNIIFVILEKYLENCFLFKYFIKWPGMMVNGGLSMYQTGMLQGTDKK